MNPIATCTASVLLIALSSPASGHPLHGADAGFAAGFMHPLLGLDHLLAMVAVGIWVAQLGGRALWAIPLSFTGTMLIGYFLGIAGHGVPHVESMVAASVLALGLLIAGGSRAGVLVSALLVSMFALFHGVAHGSEVSGHAVVLAYAAGFSLASTLLQLLGAAVTAWGPTGARFVGAPIALAGCWLLAGALA